jgi:hypothetical protein
MMSGTSTVRTFHNQDQLEEHGQDHMIVNKFRPLSPEAKKLILYFSELPERQQAIVKMALHADLSDSENKGLGQGSSSHDDSTSRHVDHRPSLGEIVPAVEDFWEGILNPH